MQKKLKIIVIISMNRMAEASSSLYNVEQVLNLLEEDPDDDDEFDEVFFPGSDDELGLF